MINLFMKKGFIFSIVYVKTAIYLNFFDRFECFKIIAKCEIMQITSQQLYFYELNNHLAAFSKISTKINSHLLYIFQCFTDSHSNLRHKRLKLLKSHPSLFYQKIFKFIKRTTDNMTPLELIDF